MSSATREARRHRLTASVRLAIALTIVAAGAAAFAVTFRASLAFVYQAIYGATNVVDAIVGLPAWLRLLVPAAGGLAAGLIARAGGARGQNVSNVMEAVALGTGRLSVRATTLRVAASWLAIASGMSIGREGPLIEFGGTLGAYMGRLLRVTREHLRVLVAAGTAAGFASAYNTPFAAVLFVLETVIGIAAPVAVLPAIAATVVAAALTRAAVGGGPIYGQRAFAVRSNWEWVAFAVVAILSSLAAHVFKRLLAAAEDAFEGRSLSQPWRSAVGGLLVGCTVVAVPMVAGNGYEPINLILDGRVAAVALIVLLAAKWFATAASVGSGVPGGVFTPVLLSGCIIGSLSARALGLLVPGLTMDPGGLALVGMAAAIAGSIHAPLTAAVMVFELSGDYAIVLPLLLVATASTGLARAIGSQSIYEAELRRRGLGWDLTLEGRQTKRDA